MGRPDYAGGSIVNLVASLRRGFGGAPGRYAALNLLPPERVEAARHVVLLLIDGLGHGFLQRHARAMAPALAGSLTSVFPSATAPAISSYLTGTAPQQHAITGWFMHFRELGVVSAVLPFRPRWGGPSIAEAGVAIDGLLGAGPWNADLSLDGCMVSPVEISDSAYNRALSGTFARVGYSELSGCFGAVRNAVASGRRYIYAYWPGLDFLSHQHGCESRAVIDHYKRLDSAVARLARDLAGTGTLLLVTADHGFIDLADSDVVWLHDHPELEQCLAQPLCGEPRAAYLYVRPGHEERLERYVRENLADAFDLLSADQLIADGWLGHGEPEARLRARVGDYALLGKDHKVIKDRLPHEGPWRMIGVHGGQSDEEMLVPLLIWDC